MQSSDHSSEPPEAISDAAENIVIAHVPQALNGQRLDKAAAQLFPQYSRARLQAWIEAKSVRLGGEAATRRTKVFCGDVLTLSPQAEPSVRWQAQPVDFTELYSDDSIVVINKPAGLVVHPGAGNVDGTLANGLLHRYPELEQLSRAGIVHRLDKDTTGLLVVARSLVAHNSLVEQLQQRQVKREYMALVRGHPPLSGRIDLPLGRHPRQRQRMAVRSQGGKEAITDYSRIEPLAGCALMQVNLLTGRTHQIRVHFSHLGFALVGDSVYRDHKSKISELSPTQRQLLQDFPRQALHAHTLALTHPQTKQHCQWQAPLPEDFESLLQSIRAAP